MLPKSSKYLIPLLLACCFHFNSKAQIFGGNPAAIKWQQINTDTARIIFPKGVEIQAKRVASIIHQLQQTPDKSIGNRIKKINIVLQNNTTISNGYVGLAPYRSEYYLNAPQNPFELGATNWIDDLALPEWRHTQQFSNFNKGISKLVSVILGEQGQALANSTAVPDWFFEGDAVLNETKLSNGGRGRLPLFFSGFKSIAQNNLNYNYMQLRNGSFKNSIPNHYNLGYLLVAYGLEKYGEDFWKKVTGDAAAFKPLIYPMQGAVKKHAGTHFKSFVKDAFDFYKTQWKTEQEDKYEFITPLKIKDVVNYQHPYVTDNGTIIVLKSSNKKIPTFYTIDKDLKETKIAIKDISIDDYFSYNNGKIIYATYKPDSRWGNKDFSHIKLLDVTTGKEQTIKSSVRYFSPDISHDGKKVVAVEINPDNEYKTQSKVTIMNTDGSDKQTSYSKGQLYSYPKFSINDSFVYVISRTLDGSKNSIVKIGNNEMNTILTTNNTIGFLQVTKNAILFTVTSQNKDELWSYRKDEQNSYKLAAINTGLYKGDMLDDTTIIAATPTAYGYRLVKIRSQKNASSVINSNSEETLYSNIGKTKYESKSATTFLQEMPERKFSISKYRMGFHLFNFHRINAGILSLFAELNFPFFLL